jgi:hypothetical protein
MYGVMYITLHTFLKQHKIVMSGKLHALVALPLQKSPHYIMGKRLNESERQSQHVGGKEKNPHAFQELNPGCIV